MGMSCPSHSAHPEGAKLNPNIRISATNGSAMATSLGREDSEKGDDEADAEKRHHVVVRLAAAPGRHRTRGQGDVGRIRYVQVRRARLGGYLPERIRVDRHA